MVGMQVDCKFLECANQHLELVQYRRVIALSLQCLSEMTDGNVKKFAQDQVNAE